MIQERGIALSVVIPAYNAESTIRRCLDSIFHPFMKEIEVICVDDGSNDGTGSILDEYAEKFGGWYNLKVIHSANGGVSCARNRGIEAASGKYITFVDADDYVDNGVYRNFLSLLHSVQPDMLEFGFFAVSEKNLTRQIPRNGLEQGVMLNRAFILDRIVPRLLNLNGDSAWFIDNYVYNKIFKGEIIRTHSIRFDETRRMWEDRLFEVCFLKYAQSYYSLPEYGYYYVGTEGSLSKSCDKRLPIYTAESFRVYQMIWGDRDSFDFYSDYSVSYYCRTIADTLMRICGEYSCEEIKKELQELCENEECIRLFSMLQPENRSMRMLKTCFSDQPVPERVYEVIRQMIKRNRFIAFRKNIADTVRRMLSKIKRCIQVPPMMAEKDDAEEKK